VPGRSGRLSDPATLAAAVQDPATTPAERRPSPWLALALAACAAAILGMVALTAALRRPAPEVYGQLPAFALRDQQGRPVTLESLHGRPWIADFIFTRCAGVCPAMTTRMSRLAREVAPGTRFVSFTVDPGHDTPEVLAAYARAHHATDSWSFVSGSQPDLFALAVSGFKLAAMEAPPGESADGPFLHSPRFVLVDDRGRVRGYYDSADEEALGRLRADLERIQ
jgi:protein SCO1